MAESIADLHIQLRASADKIAADIRNDMRSQQGAIQAQAVAVGVLIANGITAGLRGLSNAIRSAVGMGFEGLDRIDALDEAASKIGATYNGLQTLKFAAESTGSSFEAMTGALAKMQGNIASGSAAEALGRLRLEVETLRALTPEQQFAEIAQRLSEIQNTGDKIDLTKQIFGRGGVDILNVINQGKAGLAEMGSIVQTLGGHLTAVQRTMVTMANDNLDQMKAGWGFIKDQIAVGIAPVIVALSAHILQMSNQVGGIGPLVQRWVDHVINFAASLATAGQVAGVLVSAFQTVGTTIGALVATGQQAFRTLITGATTAAANLKTVFRQIVFEIEKAITESLNKIIELANRIPKAASSVVDTIKLGAGFTMQKVAPSVNFSTGPPTASQFDLPTGGPNGDLFPMLEAPTDPGMTVDYSKLGEDVELFKTTSAEAFRVVGDAAAETGDKMKAIWDGDFAGDQIRQSTAQARAAMEADAAARVENSVNTAAQIAAIDTQSAAQKITTAAKGNELIVKSSTKATDAIIDNGERSLTSMQQMNQSTIGDIVTSWATGTGKISDIVSQWASRMIQQFIQLSLFGSGGTGGVLGSVVGGLTGSSGGWAKALGTIVGGFFADGGRPPMGKVSVVGEKGPELFVPDSAGKIIPNHKAASFAGGGGGGGGSGREMPPIININQSFATGVTRAELAGSMDEVIDRTRESVAAAVGRGGGFRKRMQS